jgi:hypothetical protein
LPYTRVALAATLAGLVSFGIASSASAQTTTRSSPAASCPSAQTVMTSSSWQANTTSPLTTNSGYLCAFEYHNGNRNIGAGSTQTFSQDTNVEYYPQYYCWISSDEKVMTYAHAEIFGSGSVSATNWGTGSHIWGAGYLYTLGAGTVSGFSNGCYDNAQVWQNPPNILRITNITASGLPNGGASKAGRAYTVSVSVTPGSAAAGAQVGLQDNGANVAGGVLDSNGQATLTWTPALMGARNIQVAWPGQTGAAPNITPAYTVNVSGGVAATIASPVIDNGNGTATVTVDVDTTPDPFPAGASVVLIDATTKAAVGMAALAVPPAAGGTTSATPVLFRYTYDQSYQLLAKVMDSAGNTLGQSYTTPFKAPARVTVLSPKVIGSLKCQATVKVEDGSDGSTASLYNYPNSKLGFGTLSAGSTTISFTCFSSPLFLVGRYSTGGQTFESSAVRFSLDSSSSERSPATTSSHLSRQDAPSPATTAVTAAPGVRSTRAETSHPTPKAPAPRGNRGIVAPGDLTAVNTGALSVSRSAEITSRRRSVSAQCRTGYYPLHGQGATSGPDPTIGVSFVGRRATFTSSPTNIGHRISAQVTCRAASAKAQVIGPKAYGTRGRDTFALSAPNGTIFAGPGRDRIRALGNNSSAWGGLGNDHIVLSGRDSVADGGPGRDRLTAKGTGRKLLIGGRGKDLLVGGTGAMLINAKDGSGGDRIICRSASTRVMLDAGDITSGPCRQINTQ